MDNLNQLQCILNQCESKSVVDRVNIFSQLFLGYPYLAGAQGEGMGADIDQNPLYRFDVFDCVTYVNNVLALSFARNPESFMQYLLKLNYYYAKPIFENRFHFMSCDWNPQNQAQGFLLDITNLFQDDSGKCFAVTVNSTVNRAQFLFKKTNGKFSYQNKDPIQTVISYLPLKKIVDIKYDFLVSQFPDVSVVEVVRPNWDLVSLIGTKIHVSHLGFVLKQNNRLLFRHASSELKKVVQVDLFDYLNKHLLSSTIKGINVQAIS